jgi:hypothetical protein
MPWLPHVPRGMRTYTYHTYAPARGPLAAGPPLAAACCVQEQEQIMAEHGQVGESCWRIMEEGDV